MYGIMYGVKRTTIYLPDEMKAAVEREAARRGVTEAEVILDSVETSLATSEQPKPQLPVFPDGLGEDIAGQTEKILESYGDALWNEYEEMIEDFKGPS